MPAFLDELAKELSALIRATEIETLVRQARGFNPHGPGIESSPGVKVIHRPSGIEASCADYPSQMENRAMALVRLAAKLKDAGRL